MDKNMRGHKMSKKDIEDWSKLYNYVKKNVLGYDEMQMLTKNQSLRLKGLLNGKYIANKNIESTVDYSSEIVLLTFKYSMPDIRKALSTVWFANEDHKFNYILKIVHGNIDTVFAKMEELNKKNNELAFQKSVI